MRKRLLTFLCLVAAIAMSAWAKDPVIGETDLTSQFSSLTEMANWSFPQQEGTPGTAPTWACPAVPVNDGTSKQVIEHYMWSCTQTGDIFYTTVTGLSAGTYKIELYGAAAFTFDRGFGSTAFTGDLSVATNDAYTAGYHIDPSETVSTGVSLIAVSEGVTYGGEIPIYYATSFPNGASTVTLNNVIVGSSGQIKIGMSKTSTSTNWHVVQLKGVTATVNLTEVYGKLYDEATGLKNEEMSSEALAGLNAAMVSDASLTTADQYQQAISTLSSAINTAKASIADLKRVVFNGVYYIQNVASGKFFSVGHNYGTRGIVDVIGLDMTLTGNSGTKKTTFNSQIYYDDNKHFLGSNLYMDSDSYDWAIEKMGNDTYSISNGTQYVGVDANDNLVMVGEPVAWRFLTRADRIAALDDATEANPIDATFLIINHNFGRGNRRAPWTVSADCTNKNLNCGDQENMVAESWHSTFTISQTITGIPEGLYKMKAQGAYRQDDDVEEDAPQFFINKKTKAVSPRKAEHNDINYPGGYKNPFNAGEYDLDDPIECRVPEDITVGIKGTATHQWVVFDNFRLYYYGPVPPDKADMEPSLETAKELAGMSFKTEGKDALNAAIATAQAAYNNSESMSLKDFGAAVTALDNAIVAFRKANYVPLAGVYYVQNVASGKYMSAGHNYGTRGIVDEVGLDMTLTANGDKTVNFDSKLMRDGNNHFFNPMNGGAPYMDQGKFGWIIEKVSDDTYTISDGTKYLGVDNDNNLAWSDEPIAWKFLTKDDRLLDLYKATKSNPKDATFLIKGYNFSRYDERNNAWTKDGVNTISGGNQINNCAESYHRTINLSQTISDAPVGYYELHAQGFFRQDRGEEEHGIAPFEDGPEVYINNDGMLLFEKTGEENSMSDASVSFSNGKYTNNIESTVTDKLTIGIKGTATNQWVIFDNFRLTYFGPIPADKTMMEPVIAAAQKLAADANKTEGKEALNAAIATAKQAYDNSSAYNYIEFKAEVEKLEAAMETFKQIYRIAIKGVYYVQNAESGKYMSAGHNWGTRAIVDAVGLDLTLNANKDKTVTFDSQVAINATDHFLNNGLYMDGAAFGWSIEKMGDGTYSISDGEKFIGVDADNNLALGDAPVAWKFISMDDRKAAFDEATPENGIDVTFLIKDHNLSRNNQRNTAWTLEPNDIPDWKYKRSSGETDGSIGNNCAEIYHAAFTFSQTLSNVPDGAYELKAQGFYRQDEGDEGDAPVFIINNEKQAVSTKTGGEGDMKGACISFSAGKYDMAEPIKCTVSNGTITLGVTATAANQWVIFDNFRLTYYGPDKSKLAAVIATANNLLADVNKTEGKDALSTATAAAQTFYDSFEKQGLSKFEAEVKKLQDAIEAFRKANRIAMKGVYYVQNVASGKFMSAGHSWGTQGIIDEVGLDITLAANNDNKVSFNSQIEYNGGHFLNSAENGNLYMDQSEYSWCIEKMSDNTFSISNGTKFIGVDANENLVLVDEAVAWKFLTLENRIANLEDATEDDPMDASFLIKDNNFGRNNLRASAWQQKGINNISGGENDNGTIGNNCAESFHAVLNLSQTISNAPAGIYGLKVQGFYRQDDNLSEDAPVFFINNEKLAVLPRTGTENDMKSAANAFKEGKYDMEEPIMCEVKDGAIKVGIMGTAEKQWVIFDNFRLIYYGLSGEDITNPPVVISDLVYTGEELDVITAGSHEIGTVKYTTDKENWSTELPKFTEAGTHNVWYCVFDEDGNQLLAAKKLIIRIAPAKVSNYIKASISETEFDYDGTAKEPKVTVTGKLIAGTDYTITYEDNTNAGTAKALVTGQGNYGGSIVMPFNIAKIELTSFVLTDTLLVYNEEEQIVGVDSVMAGEIMVPEDAYTLAGNIEMAVGTHTVTLTANEDGNFFGELTAEYTIVGSPIDVCDMTLDTYQYVYSGKEKKPAVTVMRGDVKLVQGKDYKVSYKNNINAGTAKAVITGIGNYAGTKEAAFKITQGEGQLDMLNDEVTMDYAGSPFTVKPIVLLGDGVIRYASSNEDVAYVNYYTGEVIAKGVGQTTITISMASTPNATAAKTSYLLTVTPASATLVSVLRLAQGYGIPKFKVSTYKETLVEGKDYILSYRDLQGHAVTEDEMLAAPGHYVAVANLQGNFEGTSELEFTVTLDPLTGIGAVEGNADGTVRYDMGGRRVLKTHRGMVIENGKKHYMKKK